MKRLAVLLALIVAACGPVTPPTPPQPPPPAVDRYVRFTVRGEAGHLPAGAQVTVFDDFSHVYACGAEGDRANCLLDAQIPQGDPSRPDEVLVGCHVGIAAPDYEPYTRPFGCTGFSQNLDDQFLTPTFRPLVGIHAEGQHFRLDDGGRIFLAGETDFNLLAKFINGEDIEPVLEQREQLGFNHPRVFTAFSVDKIGRLSPKEHPELYARIPVFLDHLAKHGLRPELVAFTGPYDSFFKNDDEKVAHYTNLCAAMQGKAGLLETVNEYDNAPNAGVPFARLAPCPGVLTSHGSAVQDALPKEPFWNYITFHPAAGEFQRKAGHGAMELWSGPSSSNEFSRSPDQDSNDQHWFDAGQNCALLAAACVLHSVEGKISALFTGATLSNAKAFIAGVRTINLALCQDQPYRRRDDLNGPMHALRVHQRGTNDACISAPRE